MGYKAFGLTTLGGRTPSQLLGRITDEFMCIRYDDDIGYCELVDRLAITVTPNLLVFYAERVHSVKGHNLALCTLGSNNMLSHRLLAASDH